MRNAKGSAAMNDSKKRHLAKPGVPVSRARFVQTVGAVLGDVLPKQSLMKWIADAVYRIIRPAF